MKNEESGKKNESLRSLLFHSGKRTRIVNLITLFRVASFPFLLFLAFADEINIFRWLLLVAWSTDAIDGFLARRWKVATHRGAMLDSIGDDLLILVTVIAIFIHRPEFIHREWFLISLLLFLFLLQLGYSWKKYKKPSSFHTLLAKASAVFQACFSLSLFFFEPVLYPLFYFAAAVTILELVEEIILVRMLPKWRDNVKGLWWVWKERR